MIDRYKQIIECDGHTCHLYWVKLCSICGEPEDEHELRDDFVDKIQKREQNIGPIKVDIDDLITNYHGE